MLLSFKISTTKHNGLKHPENLARWWIRWKHQNVPVLKHICSKIQGRDNIRFRYDKDFAILEKPLFWIWVALNQWNNLDWSYCYRYIISTDKYIWISIQLVNKLQWNTHVAKYLSLQIPSQRFNWWGQLPMIFTHHGECMTWNIHTLASAIDCKFQPTWWDAIINNNEACQRSEFQSMLANLFVVHCV